MQTRRGQVLATSAIPFTRRKTFRNRGGPSRLGRDLAGETFNIVNASTYQVGPQGPQLRKFGNASAHHRTMLKTHGLRKCAT
jgi:hypothetical protein